MIFNFLFSISLKRDGGIEHVRQSETSQFILIRVKTSDSLRLHNLSSSDRTRPTVQSETSEYLFL
jgi:hypothetical protein